MDIDIQRVPMESSAVSALTESTAKKKTETVLPGATRLGPTREQLNVENRVGVKEPVQETSEVWKAVADAIKGLEWDEYLDEMGGMMDRGNGVFASRTDIQG